MPLPIVDLHCNLFPIRYYQVKDDSSLGTLVLPTTLLWYCITQAERYTEIAFEQAAPSFQHAEALA
jgi:hypothetical protein